MKIEKKQDEKNNISDIKDKEVVKVKSYIKQENPKPISEIDKYVKIISNILHINSTNTNSSSIIEKNIEYEKKTMKNTKNLPGEDQEAKFSISRLK